MIVFPVYEPKILSSLLSNECDFEVGNWMVSYKYWLQDYNDTTEIEEILKLLEVNPTVTKKALKIKNQITDKYRKPNSFPILIGLHFRRSM